MLSSIYVWCVRYRSSIFNYVINILFWAEWDFRNKYFKKMFSQKELSKSQKFFCHQLIGYWQFVEALQKAYSDMSEWLKSLSCVRLCDPMACRSLPLPRSWTWCHMSRVSRMTSIPDPVTGVACSQSRGWQCSPYFVHAVTSTQGPPCPCTGVLQSQSIENLPSQTLHLGSHVHYLQDDPTSQTMCLGPYV